MRINFFAGACAGKSTTAAEVFARLKRLRFSVDLVLEYIKGWTYLNRLPKSFDQVYIFGKQLQYEDRVLASGVKNIVTDSPIALSAIYSRAYSNLNIADYIEGIADAYDKVFPSVSIFLERGNKPFNPEGRWGTREDAEKIDLSVRKYLLEKHEKTGRPLLFSNWDNVDEIMNFAIKHMDIR